MIASFQRPSASVKPINQNSLNQSINQDAMMQQWLNGTTKPASKQLSQIVDPFAQLPPPSINEHKDQLINEFDHRSFNQSLSRQAATFTDQSIDAKQRLSALRSFALVCGCDDNQSINIPQHHIDNALSLHIKSLLRRCADASEACRDCAVDIVTRLAERSSVNAFARALPFVIPAMAMRLHCRDLTSAGEAHSSSNPAGQYPLLSIDEARYESSEEVRTRIMNLAAVIIKRFQPRSVDEVNDDVVDSLIVTSSLSIDDDAPFELSFFLPALVNMIAQGLADRSPAIKQLANQLLVQLCESRSHEMRSTSMVLARVCMSNMLHVHHRVRSSSIDSMRVLIPIGAGEIVRDLAAFRESNVIDINGFFNGETRHNYLAALIQDQHATVRRALIDAIGDWMMNWPEQSDYETLLFPYLLTGLHDDVESNRQASKRWIDRLGARYETDFRDALRDELEYAAMIDTKGPRSRISAMDPIKLDQFAYSSRPDLGVRHYCRRSVDRLMGAITTELCDWQTNVELHSVLLLRSLLFIAEERLPPAQLGSIVEAALLLTKRVKLQRDVEKDMVMIAARCDDVLALIGRYVDSALLLRRLLIAAEAGQAQEARYMAHTCMQTAPSPAPGNEEVIAELMATIDQLRSVG